MTGASSGLISGGTALFTAPGGSGVTSVFGRTGAVTAQTGDYNISQISGAGTAAAENLTSVIIDNGSGGLTIGAGQVTAAMLAPGAGGTIGGSIATNQVAFGSGTNAITGSANLTFDGTTFQLGASQIIKGQYSNTAGSAFINPDGSAVFGTNASFTNAGNLSVPAFKLTASPTNGYVLTSDASGNGTWVAPNAGTVTSVSIVTANGISGTVATATTTPAVTLVLGAITPTSVAATGTVTGSNLSGTNTGNVTIGTANGLSLSGQAISLALASTSTTGALSSTDWNTFNNKQPAGTYVTSVAGTTNRITSSGGTTPAIDISASYVGQTSITTLGTITTGTWNGTAIDATHGGTAQTTYTLGDTLYSSATNTLAKLAGNTAATKQFLSQTGTGTVSAAPVWGALVSGDIPNNAANTTGSAAKWTTARLLAGNSVDGSANVAFANKFIVQGTADAGLSGAQFLGALTTGLVKNTTTTGVLTIAVAGTDYQAPGNYITALTGDATASGPGSAALTLATVNTNVGSFGSSTAIPNFTVNAKGLITVAGTSAVIAPAGTLTGTTLASNVVTSSLTSVGTLASLTVTGATTGGSFVKSGGTSSQFLKADGSVDSSSYLTSQYWSLASTVLSNNSGSIVCINTSTPVSAAITGWNTSTMDILTGSNEHLFISTSGIVGPVIGAINATGTYLGLNLQAATYLLLNATGLTMISATTNATSSQPCIGIALNNATARLHLPVNATGANRGQLKFTLGGSLMTTPEAGAMEAINASISWTDSTGARQQLNQQAGTGLTLTTGTFSVNASQNITTLSNLTSNGFVKTTGGTGALSIDTTSYQPAFSNFTSTQILFGNGTSTPAQSSRLTFNSTTGQTLITASNGGDYGLKVQGGRIYVGGDATGADFGIFGKDSGGNLFFDAHVVGASLGFYTDDGSGNTAKLFITAAGAITTGLWNATVIAGQYGGTGVANTGKTITLGGNLTTSGAFASTFTMTGTTTVTFPTSGTLLTSAGAVTSITGTANQVIASASTDAVTLSLPQSINTAAAVTFNTIALNAVSPTAAVGKIGYNTDGFTATIDSTSGLGNVPIEQEFFLDANAATPITTAATNFFGTTSNVSLVAGARYQIEIYFKYLKTTAAAVTFTFTNSSAPTQFDMDYELTPTTGMSSSQAATRLFAYQYDITALAPTIVTGSVATGADHLLKCDFYLRNGTGTSLKLQAQTASGSLTPLAGSWWKCTRLPANSTGNFAA